MPVTGFHGEYELTDEFDRVDFETVHGWLTGSYWSPGISLEKVVKAARGTSMVVSAFRGSAQVGYMRVISDKTTFAWLADVYVDEGHRGKGLAKALVQFALDHPEYQGLRRWVLATRDAQPVYESVGFKVVPNPESWMIRPGG